MKDFLPFEKMEFDNYSMDELLFMARMGYPEIIDGEWYHPRHCERHADNQWCHYYPRCKKCTITLPMPKYELPFC